MQPRVSVPPVGVPEETDGDNPHRKREPHPRNRSQRLHQWVCQRKSMGIIPTENRIHTHMRQQRTIEIIDQRLHDGR